MPFFNVERISKGLKISSRLFIISVRYGLTFCDLGFVLSNWWEQNSVLQGCPFLSRQRILFIE